MHACLLEHMCARALSISVHVEYVGGYHAQQALNMCAMPVAALEPVTGLPVYTHAPCDMPKHHHHDTGGTLAPVSR